MKKGQGMVEFMLALPILLFVIFGIIEFARLTFAWMAVQNAARFGIRYAVTGEFDEVYCVQAGNILGADHINADVFGGDDQDCLIPDGYPGIDARDKERELIDLARLYSIQGATSGGGAGLWIDPAVGGDYFQYLTIHDEVHIGQVSEDGFLNVTVCSNRSNQFAVDYNNYQVPLCVDSIGSVLMDDAGGPGDRVKVRVDHTHPLFLPILSNIWPSVSLNAERDGIVERFRVSRVMGVSGPILSAPTWTQTPTVTNTPTNTSTPIPSVTPIPTNTAIPVQCDLIEVVNSYAGHWMSGYYINSVTIRNNNPVPITLYSANQIWQKNDPGRYLWAMQFDTSGWNILNDMEPPTEWTLPVPVVLGPGGQGEYIALFMPQYVQLEGLTSVDLVFDNGCHKGVTVDVPTPTPTPIPNCDLYSLSGFDFHNSHQQEIAVNNGDIYDTKVTRIRFDWTYTEQWSAANGWTDLHVDWMSWNGADVWGWGDWSSGTWGRDDNSWTDTSLESSSSWMGPLEFTQGSSNPLRIDFDGGPGQGSIPQANGEDFGLIIDFENGCQLVQHSIQKEIVTWTPTPTPEPSITPSPTPTGTATFTPPPPTSTSVPNCDDYSIDAFSFRSSAQLRTYISNGDAVDANLTSLELIWNYPEQYANLNGFPNFNMDWFKWGGSYFPGHDEAGTRDYSSSSTWTGSIPFSAGNNYRWDIDFDSDWAGGGTLDGVFNSDFGIVAQFDNGCTITRSPIARPVPTFTNTPIPSITPVPSNTPVPSYTPLPTNTPLPPTPTKSLVPSATQVPSATPIPPTPTETPIPTWTPACPYDDPNWPCQPTWTPTP